MTFATEPIAFCEVDELPVVKPQFVAISSIVAVKAPSHRLGMMELDIQMFILQLPLFSVHLQGGMASAAGKHTFCHGRRGDGKFLTCTTHKGDKANPRQKPNRNSQYLFIHSVVNGGKNGDPDLLTYHPLSKTKNLLTSLMTKSKWFINFLQDLAIPRGQNLVGRGDFSRPKGQEIRF
jgi:hypothetical protein